MLSGNEILVILIGVLGLAALVGVVVVGVIAFARSTQRSDVRRASVDDPGLNRRRDEADR